MERWNNVPWSVEVSESTQPAETSLPRNRSSRTSAGRTSRTRNSNTSASTLAKFLEFFTFKIIVITVVLIVIFVGIFVVIVLLVSKGSIEEDVFTDENLEKSFTSMVVTSRRTTRVRTTVLTTTRSSTALRNQVGRKLFDKTDHILFVFPHLLVLLPTPLPTLFNWPSSLSTVDPTPTAKFVTPSPTLSIHSLRLHLRKSKNFLQALIMPVLLFLLTLAYDFEVSLYLVVAGVKSSIKFDLIWVWGVWVV